MPLLHKEYLPIFQTVLYLKNIYKPSVSELLTNVKYKMVMMEMTAFIIMMTGFIITNNALGIVVPQPALIFLP